MDNGVVENYAEVKVKCYRRRYEKLTKKKTGKKVNILAFSSPLGFLYNLTLRLLFKLFIIQITVEINLKLNVFEKGRKTSMYVVFDVG